MKVLVTGGAGFIGSHITEQLIKSGNEVIVLDNLSNGRIETLSNVIDSKKLTLIKADILDKDAIAYYSKDCKTIIHLAANPDVRIGYTNTSIDFELNIVGTKTILDVFKSTDGPRRLLFASTSTIYGEPAIIPTSEDYAPLAPISLYGASKLACESLISAYCHLFRKEAIIFRLANVIGSRSNHGIIYDFVKKLNRSKDSLEILGDGKQRKSYVHVSDCVNAFLLGLDLNISKTIDFFNVGSLDFIDVQSIAEIVIREESSSSTKLKFQSTAGDGRGWKGDVREMLLDTSKIRSRGWAPKYNSSEAAVKKATTEIISEIG